MTTPETAGISFAPMRSTPAAIDKVIALSTGGKNMAWDHETIEN